MKSPVSKLGLVAAILLAGIAPLLALDKGIVITQADVPVNSLSAAELKDLLTGKTTYWAGGQAVIIVSMGEKVDPALQEACGMSASQFKTFWQRLAFSGRGQQPKSADDPDKAIALVSGTKGAIAIVPTGANLQGVKKLGSGIGGGPAFANLRTSQCFLSFCCLRQRIFGTVHR